MSDDKGGIENTRFKSFAKPGNVLPMRRSCVLPNTRPQTSEHFPLVPFQWIGMKKAPAVWCIVKPGLLVANDV